MRRLGALLASVALFAGSGASAKVFEPTTFTLKNGLRVVVVENHLAPVVTQMVWYKCGAADEVMGKSGIAHFLEHLMFKGTKTVPAGELSKIVGRNGGTDNAFTAWDYTAYFQTIAADRLDLVMKLESDRMSNLVLTDAVVLPERDVIVEERRQRIENSPAAQLGEAVNAAMFANHHYGIPIIGWRHEMMQLTRQDAVDWYKKWYRPANAVLVIAGDVKPSDVRALAEKYYGSIPAGQPQLRNNRPQEPHLPGDRRIVLRDVQVRQPTLVREMLAPSYSSEGKDHAYALQVLADLLGGGSTSRLYRSLVVEQKLATSVSADYTPDALDKFPFQISAEPAPGVAIDKLEAALDVELAKLVNEGATEAEIADSKKRLVDSAVLARDSVSGAAYAFGLALTTGQTVDDVEAWPDRVAKVEKPMVDAAVQLLLTKNPSTTGWLLPPEGLTAVSESTPVAPVQSGAPAGAIR
jgi:zinc protease